MKNNIGEPTSFFTHPLFYSLVLIAIVGILICFGTAYMPKPPPAVHHEFPAEGEVSGAVHAGMTEDDVLARLGDPTNRGEIDGGLEAMDYILPAQSPAPRDSAAYCGFVVYLKNGTVQNVNIIRGSDMRK